MIHKQEDLKQFFKVQCGIKNLLEGADVNAEERIHKFIADMLVKNRLGIIDLDSVANGKIDANTGILIIEEN